MTLANLRYASYEPGIVAILIKTHGLTREPILQSRFLCGNRAKGMVVTYKTGGKEDITCRKCLEVIWRNEQFPERNV